MSVIQRDRIPVRESVEQPDPAFAELLGLTGPDKSIVKWIELITRELGSSRVLEFGCGRGNLSIPLSRQDKVRVIAVDCDPHCVRALSAEQSSQLKVILANFEGFICAETVDTVVLRSCVLDYKSDNSIKKFFASAASALSVGGKLLVELYQEKWLSGRQRFTNRYQSFYFEERGQVVDLKAIYRVGGEQFEMDYLIRRRSREMLRVTARSAGMSIVDSRPTNPLSEVHIFKKD